LENLGGGGALGEKGKHFSSTHKEVRKKASKTDASTPGRKTSKMGGRKKLEGEKGTFKSNLEVWAQQITVSLPRASKGKKACKKKGDTISTQRGGYLLEKGVFC